jgi:hypothetical protein
MLIVKPRASSMAPRHADVIPFPNEETTPPVIKTYDVMCQPRINEAFCEKARNKKGLEQKHRSASDVLSSNPSNSAPSLD